MDDNEKLLVDILSTAIKDEKFKLENLKNINWNKIYSEAEAHQVHTLMYPIIKDLYNDGFIDKNIMLKWKNSTCINSIIQIETMKRLRNVLEQFNKKNIPVILLKGVVLRNLYPYPELRTMGDADILIHTKDIEKARAILINMGYCEESPTEIHIGFKNSSHHKIEVHWAVNHSNQIKNDKDFEEKLWTNTVNVDMCGLPSLSPSPYNQLMSLCMHIKRHFISSGFGFRQLCDLTLLIEAYKNEINWNDFFLESKTYEMDKFISALFIVCAELFKIDISSIPILKNLESTKYIELLINDIIESGVYGRKKTHHSLGNYIAHHNNSTNNYDFPNGLKRFLTLVFPSQEHILKRYPYAKKKILLPIAWIHRFLYNIFFHKYNILKPSFVFNMSQQIRNRTNLLKWFNI